MTRTGWIILGVGAAAVAGTYFFTRTKIRSFQVLSVVQKGPASYSSGQWALPVTVTYVDGVVESQNEYINQTSRPSQAQWAQYLAEDYTVAPSQVKVS